MSDLAIEGRYAPAAGPSRRSLIGAGGLALGALALPACATLPRPAPAVQRGCLPPVTVARNRIIRTLVGLRPYRAAGFVVRAKSLGSKRLIHNYGHGGAGITLSWGTSKLATELGLPGHRGPVAIIGAGIVGLTTARLVQEAGFPVTIYAKALTPHTLSDIAGGEWSPSLHYERSAVTPEWERQFASAAAYAYRRFQILVGSDYGIRWIPKFSLSQSPHPAGGDSIMEPTRPDRRDLLPADHPFPYPHVRRRIGMYIETPRFLRRLMQDIQIGGGRIEVRDFASPDQLASLPEQTIFNCTGLGARQLFGDNDMRPMRGQLEVLLPQPEVEYAVADNEGYMFPRSDGIFLGGTFELDNWATEPDPATTERLIDHHRRLFNGFRCSTAG